MSRPYLFCNWKLEALELHPLLIPHTPFLAVDSLPSTSSVFFPFWFLLLSFYSSVQSLSCVWLCDPMNRSTSGLSVHHQLPESAQTHVHWVGDAVQPSHPLSSPSPPGPNLAQHQGLFQWVSFKWLKWSIFCRVFYHQKRKKGGREEGKKKGLPWWPSG